MMTKELLAPVACLLLLGIANAPAQNMYVFTYAGTSSTTDSNGPAQNSSRAVFYAADDCGPRYFLRK